MFIKLGIKVIWKTNRKVESKNILTGNWFSQQRTDEMSWIKEISWLGEISWIGEISWFGEISWLDETSWFGEISLSWEISWSEQIFWFETAWFDEISWVEKISRLCEMSWYKGDPEKLLPGLLNFSKMKRGEKIPNLEPVRCKWDPEKDELSPGLGELNLKRQRKRTRLAKLNFGAGEPQDQSCPAPSQLGLGLPGLESGLGALDDGLEEVEVAGVPSGVLAEVPGGAGPVVKSGFAKRMSTASRRSRKDGSRVLTYDIIEGEDRAEIAFPDELDFQFEIPPEERFQVQ